MATRTVTLGMIDAAEANELADLFSDLSQAVGEYRLADHTPPLSMAELARLKDEAQVLENRSHHFTAAAIGASLKSVQSDLDRIKSTTEEAAKQLGKIESFAKVISIVVSASSLAGAIATGNPALIIGAVQDLTDKVAA
jgi:DNA repair exonuclease SbcCD ATPase subunit